MFTAYLTLNMCNLQTRNDLSVLSRSYQESPFYRGRTTYGGASASNKQSAIAGSPYHVSWP